MPADAPPPALTIAGSDPSGGAGLQVDLKTFQSHGVYGMAVVTLITVQNTRGVDRVETLAPDLVVEQLGAVLDDIPPAAMKTGSLGSPAIIGAVTKRLDGVDAPLVVDPVMVSKHGALLVDGETETAFRELLLPRATLVTPNRREAERLTGREIETLSDLERAASELSELGPACVLVKGGVLPGRNDSLDALATRRGVRVFVQRRLLDPARHGAGCMLSAAITARLALGEETEDAVERSLDLVSRAMERGVQLGGGIRPLSPFCEPAP